MSKLESKIFEKIKNKTTEKNRDFKITDAMSLSYVFITPIIIAIAIDRYFVEYFKQHNDMFLLLMNCAFFIGGFSVYREITKICSADTTENEKKENIKNNVEENK